MKGVERVKGNKGVKGVERVKRVKGCRGPFGVQKEHPEGLTEAK